MSMARTSANYIGPSSTYSLISMAVMRQKNIFSKQNKQLAAGILHI
jgi:hypothetical protein